MEISLATVLSSGLLSAVVSGAGLVLTNVWNQRKALQASRRTRLGEAYVAWATAVRDAVEANESFLLHVVAISWEDEQKVPEFADRGRAARASSSATKKGLRDAYHVVALTETSAAYRQKVKAITELGALLPTRQAVDQNTDPRAVARGALIDNEPRGKRALGDLESLLNDLAASDRLF